jgi:hypothetical protein
LIQGKIDLGSDCLGSPAGKIFRITRPLDAVVRHG